MSIFQPVHFVPKGRQAQMLEIPVHAIIAAPHSKKTGTNHWCLYLMTSERISVRIDCQPSYCVPSTVLSGGSKANLIVSELPYVLSLDAQTRFNMQVPANIRFKDVYNLLIQNGRQEYEFDANGVGCRFWTNSQIDLLRDHQLLVDSAEVAAVKNGILLLWPDQTSLALDQGAYYQ
ncbi:hypothetical protein BDV19DRAFT_402002 [Aspergillus venezuelensis]